MAPSTPGSANDEEIACDDSDEEHSPDLACQSGDEAMLEDADSDLVMSSGTPNASCQLSSGGAAVSGESDGVSNDGAQVGLVGARGWQPGINSGAFISRTEPPCEQAQVLITNVYANMRRLPTAVARSLLYHVGRHAHVRRNLSLIHI